MDAFSGVKGNSIYCMFERFLFVHYSEGVILHPTIIPAEKKNIFAESAVSSIKSATANACCHLCSDNHEISCKYLCNRKLTGI